MTKNANDFQKLLNKKIEKYSLINKTLVRPLTITKIAIDEYGTKTITLSGGNNGYDDFETYCAAVKEVYHILLHRSSITRLWFIKAKNDCQDDIFDIQFGYKEE